MSRTLIAQHDRGVVATREPNLAWQGPELLASESVSDERAQQSRQLGLFRRYGDFTLAYSTAVQPGLSYFFSDGGYIAYATKWGYVHALGDPVAAAQTCPQLLDSFLQRFPKAGFYQVSPATARHLEARRFYINEMGIDTKIDLSSYTFDGKSKEFLRYSHNWLLRRGFRIEERRLSEISQHELLELDARWKATRRVKSEVRFLNRPMSLADEPDVRRFFLFDAAGKMLAFVFFDPLCSDGRVMGYTTAFKRRDGSATNGYAEPGIMRTAIATFQREGISTLRLGLSPLANIENLEFRKNWFLHHSFRYGFKSWWVNRFFYNLQGHAAFKQRFGGIEEKTYFATPSLANDLRLAGMLRYTGII
jgi:lysylphosphatidylglycerol synthetase-like protein (DUF2156 family)